MYELYTVNVGMYLAMAALALFLLTATTAAARPRVIRDFATGQFRNSNPSSDPGLYELAYLAGGPRRAIDAAICAMVADGRMRVSRSGFVSIVTDAAPPADPFEERLYYEVALWASGVHIKHLRATLKQNDATQAIHQQVKDRGLLARGITPLAMNVVHRVHLITARTAIFLPPVVLLLGQLPEEQGTPVLIAAGSCVAIGALGLLVLYAGSSKRPDVMAKNLLNDQRRQFRAGSQALLGAGAAAEVALFGPDVLTDQALATGLAAGRPGPLAHGGFGASGGGGLDGSGCSAGGGCGGGCGGGGGGGCGGGG